MRGIDAFFLSTVVLAGCAARTGEPAVATPAAGQRPAWQQQMDEARRQAAAGNNYVLVVRPREAGGDVEAGVFVFYNKPDPFCYTYMIPGEWFAAPEANAYRSRDGGAFVGVTFVLPADLEGFAGATPVERMGASITSEYEGSLGERVSGVELGRFESARPGTWKWEAAAVAQGDRRVSIPPKVLVDLSPDAIVQITVSGTPDDGGLARRIIEGLRTTSDPECYWPVLERMLRSAFGGQ